jgi:hypothetical protein
MKMPFCRSDAIPSKFIPDMYRALESAMLHVKVNMREQHNKDTVLNLLKSEIDELKALVNN